MNVIIVAFVFVALAAATPSDDDTNSKIKEFHYESEPNGVYKLKFETDNGIYHSTLSEIREIVDENKQTRNYLVVRGEYAYPRKDGSIERIVYFADKTGYHAQGDSIPRV